MLINFSPFLYFFTILMQPIRIGDLKKVNPIKACEFFNRCFKDPSTFTVVIVGNINPSIAIPLMLQYLVSNPWLVLFELSN
jgi:hypothetical protein